MSLSGYPVLGLIALSLPPQTYFGPKFMQSIVHGSWVHLQIEFVEVFLIPIKPVSMIRNNRLPVFWNRYGYRLLLEFLPPFFQGLQLIFAVSLGWLFLSQ